MPIDRERHHDLLRAFSGGSPCIILAMADQHLQIESFAFATLCPRPNIHSIQTVPLVLAKTDSDSLGGVKLGTTWVFDGGA